MATVRSKCEQPLDNELVNCTIPVDNADLQHASDKTVARDVGVCVHGNSVQETEEADVTSSPSNENSSPHGSALSPHNKDASDTSCKSTATVGEQKMGVDVQGKNGELVSTESGEDCVIMSDHLHNENRGQEINKEIVEKTPEIFSSEHTIKELTNVNKEKEFHGKATQEETGDPNSMVKDKHSTEERAEEDVSGTTSVVKQRRSRLECKECGKQFTRRETYNLHRHFHMHQDEEASLACKECGITFQHRSDLIKHRSTHKEDCKPKIVSDVTHSEIIHKRRRSRDKICKRPGMCQCEHCGMCFSTMLRLRLHACELNVDKPFRCPLCRKEFQYRVSINTHMQSHSLDSPYRCLECNKGFQSVEMMHIHQRSHAALKPYECPDCNMVFRHRSVMEDHRRRHTEEKPHHCKICGKNFKYSSLLQQHKYLHTGRMPYQCTYCGKRFAFAQNMRAHYRQHKNISHSAISEAPITNNKLSYVKDVEYVDKENTNHDVEQQRNCPLCPEMFYKAADLRAHMLIHEAEYERMANGKRFDNPYACRFCPLNFPTEHTLQSHLQTHQTNILSVNTSHTTNHVNAVPEKQEAVNVDKADIDSLSGGVLGDQTEKKPFRCRDCGKTFRYRSVLELHMRIHNKGYQCPVCKKSFKFSSYLQQHSIIHTGKKPHKCPDCGKDFAFLHNMKTHQRLHKQKPFRCTQCRKGYSDESQLQRHVLSHTGEKPYKCHLCDKSFSLAYLLRDHLNTHTGERPHRCQECHKSFPWLSSLLVHQKIHMRKRQGHSYALSIHSPRGRIKEIGSRGRRGRPRLNRDNVSLRQDAGQRYRIQETLLSNALPQQIHDLNAVRHECMGSLGSQHLQTNNQSQTLQQEWQVQIPSSPQELHSQKGFLEAQTDVQMQWVGSHLKTQSGLATNHYAEIKMSGSEQEQKDKHPAVWVNTPNSNQQKTSPESSLKMDRPSSPRSKSQSSPNHLLTIQDDSLQTGKLELFNNSTEKHKANMDLDAPPTNESDKPTQVRKEDLKDFQKSPGLANVALTEMAQTGGIMLSTGASSLQNTNPWGLKASFEMSTPVSLQEVSGDALEKHQNRLIQHLPQQLQHQILQQQLHQTQIPPNWVSATPSNQVGPVNMPFTSARFPLGDRPALWGFQTTPVVSQTLNGPVQPGHIHAPQHVALIAGRQIPLNQPSSFISPSFPPPTINISAPHPIHSVGRQLPGPLPQGIFFTSQGTINEIPLMTQVTNLPQLAQQTEPHKVGNKMPFPPDHLFQCMICGCSLPGELELQMHYLQHAQRDV